MSLVARLAIAVFGFAASPLLAAFGGSTVATFSSLPGGTIVWENGLTFGLGPTDGALFTAFPPGPYNPQITAAVPIIFNWPAAGILNSPATFEFRALALNAPASNSGPPVFFVTQPSLAGGFDILGPLGQPWLSGSFTNGAIWANIGLPSATFFANFNPGGLTVVSGVFQPLLPPATFFALLKTPIPNPGIQLVPGQSLSSFDPAFSGALYAVPEPATWVMLIAGFGIVGVSLRRRHAASA